MKTNQQLIDSLRNNQDELEQILNNSDLSEEDVSLLGASLKKEKGSLKNFENHCKSNNTL